MQQNKNISASKMLEIIVKTNDERTFVIKIETELTLPEFRKKVEDFTQIPISEQRLLSLGQIVTSDNDFDRVKHQQTPNVLVNQSRQMAVDPTGIKAERSEKSLVVKKFEMAWTLLANCESCIHAFNNNINPQERDRCNTPDGMVMTHSPNPCASDLGVLTERIAMVYENQGKVMAHCSRIISQPLEMIADMAHVQQKVQLMMDASRYLAVLNQTVSGFVVPLRHTAPRYLSFRANPTARR